MTSAENDILSAVSFRSELYSTVTVGGLEVYRSYAHFQFFPYQFRLNENTNVLGLCWINSHDNSFCVKSNHWDTVHSWSQSREWALSVQASRITTSGTGKAKSKQLALCNFEALPVQAIHARCQSQMKGMHSLCVIPCCLLTWHTGHLNLPVLQLTPCDPDWLPGGMVFHHMYS